jgi:hypothetical protein
MKRLIPLVAVMLLAACGWSNCEKNNNECCGHCDTREALSDRPLGSMRDHRNAPIQTNAEFFRKMPMWIGYCEAPAQPKAKPVVSKRTMQAAPVDTVESKPAAKPAAKAKEEKKGWFF